MTSLISTKNVNAPRKLTFTKSIKRKKRIQKTPISINKKFKERKKQAPIQVLDKIPENLKDPMINLHDLKELKNVFGKEKTIQGNEILGIFYHLIRLILITIKTTQ